MVAQTEASEDTGDSRDESDGKNPDGLSLLEERAILGLLQEPTIDKAAKASGLCTRTLFRWLDKPHFSRAYRKARREAFGQAIGLTQHYAPLAVNTLATIMADTSSPAHTRVSAASTLLKFGREGIELDDLAARIDALETTAEEAKTAERW